MSALAFLLGSIFLGFYMHEVMGMTVVQRDRVFWRGMAIWLCFAVAFAVPF